MTDAPKKDRASRANRPVSLWTRIVALIALVLVSGTIVTGALSLFLLKRTLIESVDADLAAAVSPSAIANPRRNISLITTGSPSAQYTPVDYVGRISPVGFCSAWCRIPTATRLSTSLR